MGRRLILALLALGAVFAVHGIQCLAAEATHGQHAMAVTASSTALVATTSPGVGHTSADLADGHTSTSGHASGAPATAIPGAPRGSSHDVAGHLWEVCLAVLAAGLALGLTALVDRVARRVVELTAIGPGSPGRRSGRLLRPPDLSQLCLLRI